MDNNTKKIVTKYLSLTIVAGLCTFYYCASKDILMIEDKAQLFRVLADGFTIPGWMLLCVGGLVAISNTGVLDGVIYGVEMAVRMLIPGMYKGPERYYDFVEMRKDNRAKGYEFILIVGAAFTIIGLVFTGIFYLYY